MSELTTATYDPDRGVIREQRTETAGIRTYVTKMFWLGDYDEISPVDNQPSSVRYYRLVLPIEYQNPNTVKAALTAVVVHRKVDTIPYEEGCFISKIEVQPGELVVTIRLVAENVMIIAVNLEGRVVDHVDMNEPFPP